VSIIGPDLDPTLENCALVVRDPNDELKVLRDRDRIPLDVVVYTSEDPRGFVKIFQGETFEISAAQRGKPGINVPNWRDYMAFRGLGRYKRVLDRVVSEFKNYQNSSSVGPAIPDPQHPGNELPPKITEIIRDLFRKSGVPDEELDIPIGLNDLRLSKNPKLSPNEDLTIQVGRQGGYWTAMIKFARYLLLRYLIRDPNADTGHGRGSWRLRTPPDPAAGYPTSTILAEFYLKRPPGLGRFSIYPVGALQNTVNSLTSAPATWIRERSYHTFVRAPEGNYVAVSTTGNVVNINGQPGKLSNFLVDLSSFDYVAGHPSSFKYDSLGHRNVNYLGHLAEIFVNAPDLANDQQTVDALLSNVYHLTAGQEWFRFQAPLLFVNDPNDALLNTGGIARKRPLRLYDLVAIHTMDEGIRKGLIRNCSPNYRYDGAQMAWYEGMFVPEGRNGWRPPLFSVP
jgi:hypothetical protein